MRITKRQLRRLIQEALLRENHPYDTSMNKMADMYTNSDAVDGVMGHLQDAGEDELAQELDMMIQYGDDDIHDVLGMIPLAVKDRLPTL